MNNFPYRTPDGKILLMSAGEAVMAKAELVSYRGRVLRRGVGALPALLFAWRGIGGGGYGKQIVDAPPALGIVVDVEQTLG